MSLKSLLFNDGRFRASIWVMLFPRYPSLTTASPIFPVTEFIFTFYERREKEWNATGNIFDVAFLKWAEK